MSKDVTQQWLDSREYWAGYKFGRSYNELNNQEQNHVCRVSFEHLVAEEQEEECNE